MNASDIARALGGTRAGDGYLCRCPVSAHGQGKGDRHPSLLVKDGDHSVLVTCFGGCDRRAVVDELNRRGLLQRAPGQAREGIAGERRRPPGEDTGHTDADRTRQALRIWNEAQAIAGTPAWTHLLARGVDARELPHALNDVLRWHPNCPWGTGRHGCMVGLFTDAITGEAKAIHRTAITASAEKIGRKALGPTRGCILRLWPDEAVTTGLVVGEGLETTLVAATRVCHRGKLLQPAWAAGDAGHMASLPVLAGIESLTLLVDNDVGGIGQDAAAECTQRWLAAGTEVIRLTPRIAGADFADILGDAA